MSTEVSKVLQFDGTDDAVELGTAHVVGLQAGDFTVEAWVRLDALAGDYLPILGTDTASPDHGLHLAIKNHRPYLGFYDNDTAGQSELATGVWYHLAWRFTAEGGEQAIFLNGVLDASATEKSPFAGVDETVYVGRYAVDHHFPGQIAELRIWRVARTAEEILAGMHQRLTGDEPDLAACWPLDDGTGELAANRRTTLPGADHGATPATLVRTLPDGGAATPPPRLRLDGTGRVDMPRHEDLELTQYTFETWFHPDALPGAEGAVLAGRRRTSVMDFDGTDDYFAVRDLHYQGAIDGATVEAWVRTTKTSQGIIASWDRSEYWRLAVCTDVASLAQDRVFWATTHDHIDDMVGSTVVNDGTWHHVAATYDPASGAKKIYVDGALDAEKTTSGGFPFGTSTTRYGFIGVGSEAETFDGTTGPNDFFQGQMAELRIWDYARSEAELQQDMNRRLLGNESGLVAYWPLDTLTGGETPDETANSYAGVGRGDPALSTADPPPIHDAGLDLLMLTDGALRHRCLTDTGVTGPADTAAGSIAPGRWSHVAASNDGTTARTLIDGEVASEAPVTGLVAQGGGLRLGEGFAGLVAEVRLWNEALTAEEIAAGKSLRTTGDEEHLAGDWPLDEASGSVVLNRVSGGPDGTLTGGERVALLDTPFPGQQALELDGTAAYVEIPHAPEIHFAAADESFTVELWMRAAEGTAGDERVLVEKWSGIGSYPFALRYRPATGEIVFARSTGDASSSPILVSQPGCGDGVWHHVAAVKEGATLRLFVDGALAAETTDPIVDRIRGTSPVYAGSRGGTSHFFHGAITELRIWRRARTAEELASGRWPRLSGEEAGLAGYWPLNAVVDAEVADGLAHLAGALSGGTWADGEDLPLLTGAGETAPTAAFDGLTSTVTVAADPILMPASAITVEAWVRPQAAGGQAFLGPVASCGDAVSGWGLRATGTDCGFLITLDGVQHHVRWPSTAGACRWVHLAGIYDGAALTLYANGVAVAVQAVAGAITPYAGNLVIGGHPYWTSRHFQGQIAEVRVWSTARNAQQIRANLFRRLTGEEPWLAGYWPLADGEGTLAASGGGSAGNGSTDSVAWVAAELPPRVAPAPTPAPDSPDRIAGLERRLGELEAELAEVGAANELADMQKDGLALALSEKQEGIEDRRTAFRAPFEAEIAELQKQVLFRETRQAELTAAGVDAFLDDLVTDTHKKFEAAHAALAAVEGSHGLERARLALRFAAGAAGIGAIFPPVDTAVGPARITTLDVDYEPLALAEEAAETPVDTVPSVIGLTRALARRRLVAAGLEAEVYYQAVCVVAGQPSPVGRVVSQLPHAGGAAEPGSTVRLFLGKAS